MKILDAVELTLVLKSCGFRLESIDYSDSLNTNGGTNGGAVGINSSKSTSPSSTTVDNEDSITIDISCSRSKIVSRLKYKFGADESCSCPPKDEVAGNNSFWEVQASGAFSNNRRSLGNNGKVNEPYAIGGLVISSSGPLSANWSNWQWHIVKSAASLIAKDDLFDSNNDAMLAEAIQQRHCSGRVFDIVPTRGLLKVMAFWDDFLSDIHSLLLSFVPQDHQWESSSQRCGKARRDGTALPGQRWIDLFIVTDHFSEYHTYRAKREWSCFPSGWRWFGIYGTSEWLQ